MSDNKQQPINWADLPLWGKILLVVFIVFMIAGFLYGVLVGRFK